MKTTKKLKGAVALGVEVKKDKTLDKLSGKVLFPKKLALAEEQLKGVKLPDVKKHHK